MASITIRHLDDDVKTRLRVREPTVKHPQQVERRPGVDRRVNCAVQDVLGCIRYR